MATRKGINISGNHAVHCMPFSYVVYFAFYKIENSDRMVFYFVFKTQFAFYKIEKSDRIIFYFVFKTRFAFYKIEKSDRIVFYIFKTQRPSNTVFHFGFR